MLPRVIKITQDKSGKFGVMMTKDGNKALGVGDTEINARKSAIKQLRQSAAL